MLQLIYTATIVEVAQVILHGMLAPELLGAHRVQREVIEICENLMWSFDMEYTV